MQLPLVVENVMAIEDNNEQMSEKQNDSEQREHGTRQRDPDDDIDDKEITDR